MEELAGAGHAVRHDDRRAARSQHPADHQPAERRRQRRDNDGHQHQGTFQAKPGATAPSVHPRRGRQRGDDADEGAKRRQLPGRGIRGAELFPDWPQQGTEHGHVEQSHRRAETEHDQSDPRAQGVLGCRIHSVPNDDHGGSPGSKPENGITWSDRGDGAQRGCASCRQWSILVQAVSVFSRGTLPA